MFGDTVEVLGDVDRGNAQLGGLGGQVGRVGRGVVGVVRGGSQYLFGEFVDGLDDQLLVVIGRQIEVVSAAGLQPGRSAPQALHPLELTGGGAGSGKHRLHAVAQ
ncbi:Uncharacterised protein [Mycobacterium tuberculosis]|uniref:Uncharacterized protein n=1 Tax=Mycobacterium tuberculosis TaxID=1773 RepID=A0A655ICS4_MYCTX|nr:Uncharacterised protein [Mycobacterium tuberculosis]COV73448.1 Uncharacterised protein [Mycobacterium tuberculosis]COV97341.1 Uncharacterised protein [Mycobacterium tuberculosis]